MNKNQSSGSQVHTFRQRNRWTDMTNKIGILRSLRRCA